MVSLMTDVIQPQNSYFAVFIKRDLTIINKYKLCWPPVLQHQKKIKWSAAYHTSALVSQLNNTFKEKLYLKTSLPAIVSLILNNVVMMHFCDNV